MPENHRDSGSAPDETPDEVGAVVQGELNEKERSLGRAQLERGVSAQPQPDPGAETMLILLDLLGQSPRDKPEPRSSETLRRILEGYEGFRRERQERYLILVKLGVSLLFFGGGILLALKGFQDIGFFILGCATALLGEAKVGAK